MKYRKLKARLEARQKIWDNQSKAVQAATTRPGSVKGK